MSNLVRLADRLNKIRAELLAVSAELLREHAGKGAEWVVVRKRRIDRLQEVVTRLERRLR